MIYLNSDDLKTDSFQRFIDDSTADYSEAIDKAELRTVGIAKTLLKGRYNVELIFDEDEPIRDEYLIDIIVKITLAKIFGRNAARKVPSDVKEDHDWAMKQLKEINGGKIILELPVANGDDGNPKSDAIWGNNTNTNFYI